VNKNDDDDYNHDKDDKVNDSNSTWNWNKTQHMYFPHRHSFLLSNVITIRANYITSTLINDHTTLRNTIA